MKTIDIAAGREAHAARDVSTHAKKWARLGVIMVALAYAPLVLLQFHFLWQKPHFQVFPVVLAAAGALAWRELRRVRLPRAGGPVLAAVWMVICGLLLATAAALISPWLGTIATLLLTLAVAYALGSWALVRALAPALCLVALLLPPLDLDSRALESLKVVASAGASRVLDLIGVFHLREGNVLEVAGKKLMVEDACSGIQSLFVVLAGTLFLALWKRSHWLHTLALVGIAAGWAVVGNVARMVIVTWAHTALGWDLLEGWRHDLTGLVLVLGVMGLVLSTDYVLHRVGSVISTNLMSVRGALERRREERALAQAFWMDPIQGPVMESELSSTVGAPTNAPAGGPRAQDPPARGLDLGRTPFGLRWFVLGHGLLAGLVIVWLGPPLLAWVTADTNESRPRLEALNAEDLPAQIGNFERLGFRVERRSRQDDLGETSRTWSYRFGDRVAVASVDYPFPSWHELPVCYQMAGWTLKERTIDLGEPSSPAVYATFAKERGGPRHGSLLFQLLQDDGNAMTVPSAPDPPAVMTAHLAESPWSRRQRLIQAMKTWHCSQVQVFVEGPAPPSEAERAEIRAFFVAFANAVRRHMGAQASSTMSRGAS